MNAQHSMYEQGAGIRGMTLASVLLALMLTLFLEALDQTIVVTALPHITASLRGFDRYIWVMTAYLLGSTAMIPLAGKLSDQFGRKPFLLVGALLFLLGSACAGLVQDMNQLIAFRLLQGVGAGIGISLVCNVPGNMALTHFPCSAISTSWPKAHPESDEVNLH
ncbi:MFS transporter [Ktedonospora formicarum]|uniref:Major facilitator superfamily (MFS) profile domain-containing protein n=1 Tax=Ktedonospora formicarum TaxID=2778364 RepID=A0A8J3IA37_9CHLR|nr:MFS transporter [Ktedonospora formicarum]GHO48802.1 hypothetical protein KSX_69650 [Ktedonospora formicarum]